MDGANLKERLPTAVSLKSCQICCCVLSDSLQKSTLRHSIGSPDSNVVIREKHGPNVSALNSHLNDSLICHRLLL